MAENGSATDAEVHDRFTAIVGHRFADESLLSRARNHRSWCAEHLDNPSNERLEFLGDSVLGFVIADHVFRSETDRDEGSLTDIRKAVVNTVCLAEVAAENGFGAFLRLGKGEEQSGGREKQSILADLFEAFLGAVYLDGGMPAATVMVEALLGDRLAQAIADGGRILDHKSRFQEAVAAIDSRYQATYAIDATGPDHAREFTATVRVAGRVLGTGHGRSKKQAEQGAARVGLDHLADLEASPAEHPKADARGGADHG